MPMLPYTLVSNTKTYFSPQYFGGLLWKSVFKQTYYTKVYPQVSDLTARTKNSK